MALSCSFIYRGEEQGSAWLGASSQVPKAVPASPSLTVVLRRVFLCKLLVKGKDYLL